MSFRKILPVGLVVFGCLLQVGVADAQDDAAKAVAKGMLVEGRQLFDKGDFAGALHKFETAYEIVPSPKIKFNFGLAYRALGRESEALAAFESFLDLAKDTDPQLRAEAQDYVKSLKNRIAASRRASEKSAAPQATAPTVAAVPVLAPAQRMDLSARAPEPEAASPPVYTRWWFWASAGVGVILPGSEPMVRYQFSSNQATQGRWRQVQEHSGFAITPELLDIHKNVVNDLDTRRP